MDSVKYLCDCNIKTFQMFQILALCCNSCMCIDLFFSYKKPFAPPNRRMKFYILGTAIICLFSLNNNRSWLKNPKFLFQDFVLPMLFNDPDVLKMLDKADQRGKVMAALEDDKRLM